jgi:hypothetical protein
LFQHVDTTFFATLYNLGRKIFCKRKDLLINISENDRAVYPTKSCRVQAQISEHCAKKEIAEEMPKVAQTVTSAPAPKKSNVIQLQCTNFPKKPSESSESSEYSEDSDDSDDSDDNIASDSSESCACDEEGPCDHHMMMRALAKYCRRKQPVALVSGKK